jgi:hypothetical protein
MGGVLPQGALHVNDSIETVFILSPGPLSGDNMCLVSCSLVSRPYVPLFSGFAGQLENNQTRPACPWM